MIKKARLPWFTTLVCLTFLALFRAGAADKRPNVIVILADDMGFSDPGCYGSEISTPNLDKMAAEGLRFTQFYNTPRCCPSRAALLTGLYPQQAGVGAMMEDRGLPGYHGELNNHCVTVAEVLRGTGYHTLMVGKWHLCHMVFDGKKQLNFQSDVPYWENKSDWPLQRGFEEYYGTIHGVTSYYEPFSLVSNNVPIKPEGTNFYYTDSISDHAVAKHRQVCKQRPARSSACMWPTPRRTGRCKPRKRTSPSTGKFIKRAGTKSAPTVSESGNASWACDRSGLGPFAAGPGRDSLDQRHPQEMAG